MIDQQVNTEEWIQVNSVVFPGVTHPSTNRGRRALI